MTYQLALFEGAPQDRASRLAFERPDERRRLAVAAARDGDEEVLWRLLEAFLVLHGRSGAKVSANTLAAYRLGLTRFLVWARANAVSVLRPGASIGFAYARALEGEGLAPASTRVYLAAAKNLYGALAWAEASSVQPFVNVRARRDPVPATEKRRPYSNREVERLLTVADLEERVIVLLGAHAGLRVSEIAGLAWSDVRVEDPDGASVTVRGKGGKVVDVALSRRLVEALRAWRDAHGRVGSVLPFTSRWYVLDKVKGLCDRAGVEWRKRHVHGLRHSAGTRVYEETNDVLVVKDHLRHASVTSSEIYVEYARTRTASVVKDW